MEKNFVLRQGEISYIINTNVTLQGVDTLAVNDKMIVTEGSCYNTFFKITLFN
jgi:hypothetical protein